MEKLALKLLFWKFLKKCCDMSHNRHLQGVLFLFGLRLVPLLEDVRKEASTELWNDRFCLQLPMNRHEIIRYLVCSVWSFSYWQLAAAGLQKLHQTSERLQQLKVLKFLLSYWAVLLSQETWCRSSSEERYSCGMESFSDLGLVVGELRCLRTAENLYVMILLNCTILFHKRETSVVCGGLCIYIYSAPSWRGPKVECFSCGTDWKGIGRAVYKDVSFQVLKSSHKKLSKTHCSGDGTLTGLQVTSGNRVSSSSVLPEQALVLWSGTPSVPGVTPVVQPLGRMPLRWRCFPAVVCAALLRCKMFWGVSRAVLGCWSHGTEQRDVCVTAAARWSLPVWC